MRVLAFISLVLGSASPALAEDTYATAMEVMKLIDAPDLSEATNREVAACWVDRMTPDQLQAIADAPNVDTLFVVLVEVPMAAVGCETAAIANAKTAGATQ